MADAARILDDPPPSPQPIVVEQARQPVDDPFRFVPAFDALRALAILGVFTYHTRLVKYPGAAFGVDIFFTLSGFLITGVLLKEFLKKSSISVGAFLRVGIATMATRRGTCSGLPRLGCWT